MRHGCLEFSVNIRLLNYNYTGSNQDAGLMCPDAGPNACITSSVAVGIKFQVGYFMPCHRICIGDILYSQLQL